MQGERKPPMIPIPLNRRGSQEGIAIAVHESIN